MENEQRYFIMYVDISEMRETGECKKEREIGLKSNGEPIMSELGSVVNDHIGNSMPFPDEIVGANIFRISQENGIWFVDAPFNVHWAGPRKEVPDFVTSEIRGEYEYYAVQPSDPWSYYSYCVCSGVPEMIIPSMGMSVGDLNAELLKDLLVEVDIETFMITVEDQFDEKECWTDFFHCINCDELIHVDDDANNECGRCGCREPGHPAPEGIDWNDLNEEWQ